MVASVGWVRAVGYVGAVANWTIPIVAITNIGKDPNKINVKMTAVLTLYSCLFMRWSIAISPPNFPLLACHITNVLAQGTHLVRGFNAQYIKKSVSQTSEN